MGNIRYLTKEGFRNLKVNKLMSFASVTVLFSLAMFLAARTTQSPLDANSLAEASPIPELAPVIINTFII